MPSRRKRSNYRYNSKKANEYLGTAAKALSVALAVQRLVNVEYKSLNTAPPVDPNTTTSITNLTAIAQGDDFNARNGRKIRAKYLRYRGSVIQHPTAVSTGLRMMIIRDNNGSTTQPALIDLFASEANFFNNQNKRGTPQQNSRFSILYDKYISLSDSGTTAAHFDFKIPLDHRIYFSGSGSTDEGKGAIYLLSASTEATNDPILSANCMVKWIDN